MTKEELQTQILNSTKSMFRLAEAVSKLPESETRGELIYKHDKILQRLADLQTDIGNIGRNACYFGFADKCLGCCCAECEHLLGG